VVIAAHRGILKLTPAQQLFVVVNLERTERGLAPATVLGIRQEPRP
jgi:hypothetical protein